MIELFSNFLSIGTFHPRVYETHEVNRLHQPGKAEVYKNPKVGPQGYRGKKPPLEEETD